MTQFLADIKRNIFAGLKGFRISCREIAFLLYGEALIKHGTTCASSMLV